ncbi:MAG: PCRF domain-containing protein [Candidatus Azambacteria bacterium]|nr:PCRF domain-containing protein [Candidatus Azambacteria bacterium]
MDEGQKIILEIRAGAGGDEAGLFALALWRMYHHFADRRGFKTEIIDSSDSSVGGIKTLVAQMAGANIYDLFKYESGIHRVQRIPKTEKSGRIHTSTASVAVLKEVLEKEVIINSQDIKVDTFRSSGPGGQNVNKVESAIRITHLASGIVVSSQTQRSQLQNRERAMAILRAKLAEIEKERAAGQMTSERKSQIGTGERVEKIRTYNFPQDRITDHRIGKSWQRIEKILDGNLEPIIEALSKNLK